MERQITISVDVFAAIWAARLPSENTEDQILARLLKARRDQLRPDSAAASDAGPIHSKGPSRPPSGKWTDLLVWTLQQLGGCAVLSDIYAKSREGRKALGMSITREHDASAREC